MTRRRRLRTGASRRHLTRLVLVAVMALSLASSDSGAQQSASPADPELAALVAGFRYGDFQRSVASLAAWPPDRIRASARRRPTIGGDLKQIEAAAMLCSDAAILLAADDRNRSSLFLEWARALVRALPDPSAGRFKERWEAYSIAPFLIPRNLIASRQALQRGLASYPRSADLELVQGVLLELAARAETADFRGNWSVPSGTDARVTFARIEGRLISAAAVYERALALDRDLWSAHLRLGWVYSINHSPTHAQEQLRIVIDRSRTSEQMYLAHLILGGLAEQQNNSENAYAEYRLAHSINPEAQTAHLALMRVARVTGRSEEAQRLFNEYATGQSGEDPWWYFSMGLDDELSSWLHAQIA